jgi:hypothetical protein
MAQRARVCMDEGCSMRDAQAPSKHGSAHTRNPPTFFIVRRRRKLCSASIVCCVRWFGRVVMCGVCVGLVGVCGCVVPVLSETHNARHNLGDSAFEALQRV